VHVNRERHLDIENILRLYEANRMLSKSVTLRVLLRQSLDSGGLFLDPEQPVIKFVRVVFPCGITLIVGDCSKGLSISPEINKLEI
jgi:hypothetical protein